MVRCLHEGGHLGTGVDELGYDRRSGQKSLARTDWYSGMFLKLGWEGFKHDLNSRVWRFRARCSIRRSRTRTYDLFCTVRRVYFTLCSLLGRDYCILICREPFLFQHYWKVSALLESVFHYARPVPCLKHPRVGS